MNIKNQIFYHVNDRLNWQQDSIHFINKDYSTRYQGLMTRGFSVPNEQNEPVPMSAILNGTINYIQHQQKEAFMPNDYHYNPAQTLVEILPLMRTQLTLIRELIFEEVRKDFFPHKFSRYTSLHVIPANKEALSFWLPMLRKPDSKIYKVELNGTMHRGGFRFINLDSMPAEYIKWKAYQYWLGAEENLSPDDEYIFEGMLRVVEVVDKKL